MSTYGIMKARIADDLARTDLTSNIATAILDAIKHYERKRFYWNEAIASFSTVVGQEWYSSTDASWIPNIVELDSLRISISGRPWPLAAKTMDDMEFLTAGTATNGDPSAYCYYRQQIRLYPVPNQVRTMSAAYVQRFTTLSADSDTNAWMTDGEALIRTRAKILLWEDTIRGDAGKKEGAFLRGKERDILDAIKAETISRQTSGFVSAYYL